MDRIVVGVDGSPPSIAAAVWAAGEAMMRDLELTIVHVVAASAEAPAHMERPCTPLPSGYTNDVVAQGVDVNDRTLEAVAKGVDRQPPRITSLLCFGPVTPTLWEFTQQGAHMIVLGQHRQGNSRRTPLRSVTSELLQTARCPVAVVPHRAVAPARASQAPIVVGIDRQPAQLAIAMAFDEAARRTAELIAVHAVPRPASPGAAEPSTKPNNRIAAHALADVLAIWQLRYPDVVVHQTVTNRDPVQALLSLTGQAQLTVVGGGRYGSGDVKPFGGVSSAVAQGALSPVIVARRKSVGCQAETNGMR